MTDIDPKNFVDIERLEAAARAVAGVPLARGREVTEEFVDGLDESVKRAVASGVLAVTAITASIGIASVTAQEATTVPESVAAQAKAAEPFARAFATPSTSSPSNTPKTREETLAGFKSSYSRGMATHQTPAGVLTVPENISTAAVALVAKAADPSLDVQDFTQAIGEVNQISVKTEDMAAPIDTKEHKVLVLAGLTAEITQKVEDKLKEISQQPAPEAPRTAEVIKNPEISWIKETTVQGLMPYILNNPNIVIAPSSGDQVRKSLELAAQTGKTFAYNLAHESDQNVQISPKLLQLVLYLANVKGHKLVIGSVTTGNHVATSMHFKGLGTDIYPVEADSSKGDVDFKNPDIVAKFQKLVADSYEVKDLFGIDELIYKYPPNGATLLKHGQDALNGVYDNKTLDNHEDHEHVDVKDKTPVAPELLEAMAYALSPEELALIDSLDLAPDQREFLKQAIPIARKVAAETGTNATVDLAQAILESGWGRSAPGYNYHGMKIDGQWRGAKQLIPTFEYTPSGKRYKTKAWFKAYASMEESFRDHAALIARAPHYADAMANHDNWQAYLQALVNPGEPMYATAPDYVKQVSGIVNEFHLAELTHDK